MKGALVLACAVLPSAGSAAAVLKPIAGCPEISFSGRRRQAMADYVADHYPAYKDGIKLDPKMIILHFTAGPSLRSALAVFRPDFIGKDRPGVAEEGRVNVSAHYLVDRDGRVCQFMDDTIMARQVTGLNAVSIGIENVARDAGELTAAQVDADVRLIRLLKAKYPTIRYLIGHYESRRFIGRPGIWYERKNISSDHTDPGPRFMARVRAKVRDLGLSGP